MSAHQASRFSSILSICQSKPTLVKFSRKALTSAKSRFQRLKFTNFLQNFTMTDTNEITKDTLRTILEGLKNQMAVKRSKTSETLAELKAYVLENEKGDPLMYPVDKKENPWMNSSGKCLVM